MHHQAADGLRAYIAPPAVAAAASFALLTCAAALFFTALSPRLGIFDFLLGETTPPPDPALEPAAPSSVSNVLVSPSVSFSAGLAIAARITYSTQE